MNKSMMKEEVTKHLTENIIPFWKALRDDTYGGYYGYMDYNLNVDKTAEKGCILKGVGVYNEYYAANLYLMRKEIRTMALSLYTFVGPMGSKYNLICAGVLMSLLPALIVFLLCQKQIYSGITSGAVKG